MKNFKNLLLLFIAIFAVQMVQAQDETAPKKKEKIKMVMIKKTIDEDGNEKVEKIIKEGDEARDFVWIEEGEDGEEKDIRIKIKEGDIDIDEEIEIEEDVEITIEKSKDGKKVKKMRKTIDVDVEAEDGHKTIKIAEGNDGEMEVKVIKLGEGEEIPADIQKKLEELGIDLDELRGDGEKEGKVKIIKKEKKVIKEKKKY